MVPEPNVNFYAAWQPVRVNAGGGPSDPKGNSGFWINKNGLQWTSALKAPPGSSSNSFGGWLGKHNHNVHVRRHRTLITLSQSATGGMERRSSSSESVTTTIQHRAAARMCGCVLSTSDAAGRAMAKAFRMRKEGSSIRIRHSDA